MRDGHRKFDLSAKLDTYIESVCNNSTDLYPKYKSGWDAASQLDCRFQCAVQECTECCNIWIDLIPAMETECTERISYIIFGTHSKCSYHGDITMRVEGKECICEQCKIMTDDKQQNLKGGTPKVRLMKLRIMMTEVINEFMKPGGTCGKCSNTKCI